MTAPGDTSHLDARDLADLSALADGSLDPRRRAVSRRGSPASLELSTLLARERHVVQSVRSVGATVRAPPALRARIAAERPGRRTASRRRVGYGAALAAALAAVVLALVLVLPGGTPGAPSVSQAASLATLGPAAGAPAHDSTAPYELATRLGGLYFPDWGSRFGWHAVGQRTDRINGRLATTVYYSWRGHVIAYTIVAAPALRTPVGRAGHRQRHGAADAEARRPARGHLAARREHVRALGRRRRRR